MKNLALVSIVFATLGFSATANADQQTFSIGYAQSKVQDFKNIRGVNLKYRYEWNSPFGIIGSFTYMSGKESESYCTIYEKLDAQTKLKYYSLAAGPTYRFNEYVSAYGLLGVNYNKVTYDERWVYTGFGSSSYDESHNKASLMYGIGLQINPVEYLAIDIGYEGSRPEVANKKHSIDGFNIGIGYSF